MSASAQSIWYFIALIGCVIAAFIPLRAPEDRNIFGVHFGWLGLAAFIFVAFWTAVKAS